MRLPCTVDIEQLDKDIDEYTALTSRMQLAYLKDGRKKTGKIHLELERQRNIVDDRMSHALDWLIYQIENGVEPETVQLALRMSSEWRQSINVHKSPRKNPRNWQWGGYIGHVERAAYYGLRGEPQTFDEWFADLSWDNLPPHVRTYLERRRPEPITDWESMRRLLPKHTKIIKDGKAVTSAYEHAVATVGRARVFGEEEEAPNTGQNIGQNIGQQGVELPDEEEDDFVMLVLTWQNDPKWRKHLAHVWRWERILQAVLERDVLMSMTQHPTISKMADYVWDPMTLREAEFKYNRFKNKRWMRVVQEFRGRGVE